MAKFDPPWRLDPLQNIVGVGWGGGALLVIGFGYTTVDHATSTSAGWKAFFAGSDIDDLTGNLSDPIGPSVTPPGPPKTTPPEQSIPGNFTVWSYPKRETVDTQTETTTVEVGDFFHWVGYVNGGFPFFGGNFATAEEAFTSFAVPYEQVFGHPPVTSFDMFVSATNVLSSHTETQTVTTITKNGNTTDFVNLQRAANKNQQIKDSRKLHITVRADPVFSNQFISWGVALAIYTGGAAQKFKIDNTDPTGVSPEPFKPPINGATVSGLPPNESNRPAIQATFTIDLDTFQIDVDQQNL